MRLRALLVRNTSVLLDCLCWQVLSLGTLFYECVYDVKLEAPDYQFLYARVCRIYKRSLEEGAGPQVARGRLGSLIDANKIVFFMQYVDFTKYLNNKRANH